MNYYAYVRDDERDDRDYSCCLCSRFESGCAICWRWKVDGGMMSLVNTLKWQTNISVTSTEID